MCRILSVLENQWQKLQNNHIKRGRKIYRNGFLTAMENFIFNKTKRGRKWIKNQLLQDAKCVKNTQKLHTIAYMYSGVKAFGCVTIVD